MKSIQQTGVYTPQCDKILESMVEVEHFFAA